MDFRVNINEVVKVKLTDLGISILKEKREELNKHIEGRGGKGFGEHELKIDADGYTSFQHWELMSTFGSYMSAGLQLPFETDIIVTKGEPVYRLKEIPEQRAALGDNWGSLLEEIIDELYEVGNGWDDLGLTLEKAFRLRDLLKEIEGGKSNDSRRVN